jgi:hypothetical protein
LHYRWIYSLNDLLTNVNTIQRHCAIVAGYDNFACRQLIFRIVEVHTSDVEIFYFGEIADLRVAIVKVAVLTAVSADDTVIALLIEVDVRDGSLFIFTTDEQPHNVVATRIRQLALYEGWFFLFAPSVYMVRLGHKDVGFLRHNELLDFLLLRDAWQIDGLVRKHVDVALDLALKADLIGVLIVFCRFIFFVEFEVVVPYGLH